MIVARFLEWAETVPASRRADGVSALARTYLYTHMEPDEKQATEDALTALLDDPSPLVRRALAESFASAAAAPRHIVIALASDQSDISTLVLGRSPLLDDDDLVDSAAIGDAYAQAAIALRPRLSKIVSAALAEVGAREAVVALVVNPGADLAEFSMQRILERFGTDGEVREALLKRPHLSAALRADLVNATLGALSEFVIGCNWLSPERTQRMGRESREKAQVLIAATNAGDATATFARHLRQRGQLTAGLLLRSIMSGSTGLLEGALVELSGMRPDRVAGLVADCKGAGFAALYARALLPEALLPAFRAAISALTAYRLEQGTAASATLDRRLISEVLMRCSAAQGPETGKVMSLLRRFESEAAREAARHVLAALLAREVSRNESEMLAQDQAQMFIDRAA